ncbi:MAG: tautomerase family protein [Desulfobacterales bacterium]|nr:tautomerase family protein [Desulfobacterales bacterium]
MPHVIVKLYKGRSDSQKKTLADKIAGDVIAVTGCKERSVSVAFEEFEPEDWTEKVYCPDILEGKGELIKKPGYDPFAGKEEKQETREEELMAYVRGAAEAAVAEDTTGHFNPMSWLDLELEDNPQSFDPFFDTPWDELPDEEKAKRMMAIRRVL